MVVKKRPAKKGVIDEWELLANMCRESFSKFVRNFWDVVPGAAPLKWNFHMDVICNELQEVAERVFRGQPREHDVIFNISPGTSKSTLCSILFHPWTWTRMPTARHLSSSHTDQLVLDLSAKARDVIRGERYQMCYPNIKLSPDQDTKSYYRNTLGGDRLTCTVAGKSPMGFHAHFLTVDDPIDPKKARSELETKAAAHFMTEVLPSRKVDKETSVTILIMQRLSETDPTKVMLDVSKRPGVKPIRHYKLPASLDYDVQPENLKQHYVNGLMDPERLSKSTLDGFRATLGPYGFAGQFGQNPIPAEGGMFKAQYFNQRVKAAPFASKRIRYWDRASTDSGGCYSAGVLMSKSQDGSYYVEHVIHGQWEPDERNQRMLAAAYRDRARYAPTYEPIIFTEAEGGSSGKDAFKGIAKALAGFHVRHDRVTGKKEVRAEPWATQCAALNVFLVDDGTWDLQGYIDEHCSFPFGKFKDQCDASSGAFNLLSGVKSATGIHVYHAQPRGKKAQIRIAVCSKEELAHLRVDDPCLLISVSHDGTTPGHTLPRLLDFVTLPIHDVDAAEHQDTWGQPVIGYDKPAVDLVMQKDLGQRLWAFLLKQRQTNPTAIIVQDNGGEDRRAKSIAYAIADMLWDGRRSVWSPSQPEEVSDKEKAPNGHIYATVKASRGMVAI